MKIPKPSFLATLAADTVNAEERTIDVTFYSGAKIPRFSWSKGEYILRFDTSPGAVRLGALNSGNAPVLDSHRSYGLSGVLGVVESAEIADGKASATLRFASGDDDVDRIWNKVEQKIIRNVSMGAYVHKMKDVTKDEDQKTREFLAVDWEPVEISPVALGADPGAHINMSAEEESIEVELLEEQVHTVQPDEPEPDHRLAIEEARLRLF